MIGWSCFYINRGDSYGSKNIDQAIADYSEAIRVDSNSYSAYLSRAFLLVRRGDHPAAIVDLSEVIRIVPRHPTRHQRRDFLS